MNSYIYIYIYICICRAEVTLFAEVTTSTVIFVEVVTSIELLAEVILDDLVKHLLSKINTILKYTGEVFFQFNNI